MFADVESLRTLKETAVPAVVPEGCVSVAVGSKSPPAVVHACAPFRVFQVTPASVQSVNPVMRWTLWLRLRKSGVVGTRLSVEVFSAVLALSPVVLRSKRTSERWLAFCAVCVENRCRSAVIDGGGGLTDGRVSSGCHRGLLVREEWPRRANK